MVDMHKREVREEGEGVRGERSQEKGGVAASFVLLVLWNVTDLLHYYSLLK